MSHHGNVYRSGDAPPSSTFYDQGKFGRLFQNLPAFSSDSPALRAALLKIGERNGVMDAKDDLTQAPQNLILQQPLLANNPDNPDLTAGMTFLGQFLDHDMTLDSLPLPVDSVDPNTIVNDRDQRLNLGQHRAGAFDPGKYRAAGAGLSAFRQEQRRRVQDLRQPAARHLKDANLIGGTKAVFHRAQDAELMTPLALKIKDGVHHMLHHARPGNLAVLGDMADQNDRHAALFGKGDQLMRGGAHLADRAGGGFDRIKPHGLDGIDDRQSGAFGVQRGQDVAQVGFRPQGHRRILQTQPLRALVDQRHARAVLLERDHLSARTDELRELDRFGAGRGAAQT